MFLMPSHPLSKFLLQRAHDAVIPQADYLTTSIPSTLSQHAASRLSFPQPNANKSQDGVLAQVESSFKLSWDQGCAARKPFLWCLRSHLEPPAFTTVTTQLPPSSWRSSKHKGRVGTLPMARADLHAPLRHLGPWSLEESHVLVKRRQRHKSFWLRDKNVWRARGKADKNEPHVHRKP